MKTWPENLFDFLGIESYQYCEKEDTMHGIVCALSNLEAEDEKMLLMRYTCGYTDEMIAEKIGVSTRTVLRRFEHVKAILLQDTTKPLLVDGYNAGMAKVRKVFDLYETQFHKIPLAVGFPEDKLRSALTKAGLSTVGDVVKLMPIIRQKVKGIGPSYDRTIKARVADFETVQIVTNVASRMKMKQKLPYYNRVAMKSNRYPSSINKEAIICANEALAKYFATEAVK